MKYQCSLIVSLVVLFASYTHTHTHTHTNALNRIDQSDKSYLHFDQDWQDLADFIARLSNFDDDEFSPLRKLNADMARGKRALLKDDIIEAIIHAESMIVENSDIADEQIVQIADMFNELVDAVMQANDQQDDMHNRAASCGVQSLCDESALKIKKILCVLNKAIFCDVAVFRDEAVFFKHVTMKDSLDVECKARIHKLHAKEARIHELEAKKAKIHKLKADKAKIEDLEVCDLNVTCTAIIENVIINNAEICDLTVTCTATIPDVVIENAEVCNLDVTCLATIANEVVTNSTITNAIIANETVTNSTITNATINTADINTAFITNLNVSNESVCDLTVTCNILMNDTISPGIGNIYKGGDRFLSNFGVNNTFVGENSGNFTMIGANNSGFGTRTLTLNAVGNNNTATGFFALDANTVGSDNTADGAFALQNNTIGSDNTAVGSFALVNNTTGSDNTAVGQFALAAANDNQQVAVGSGALQNYTTSTLGFGTAQNVAVGFNALHANTSGNGLTAIGWGSLENDITDVFGNNTAVGWNTLNANTTGGNNTAIGYLASSANTTGINNTVIGAVAFITNTTGNRNTVVGTNGMQLNTTGSNNTVVGDSAMFFNTTGMLNVAVGVNALVVNTTGNQNTAVGTSALSGNTTGINNSALGRSALRNNTTGSSNIALGINAGINLTTGSNNIDIGNVGLAAESATIRIGTVGTQTRNFQAGIFGAGPIVGVPVLVDAVTGQLGTVPSSIRYKENIQDMRDASSAILNLRPVTFNYKSDETKSQQFGLIAEEVQKVLPALVVRGADGEIETVKYHELAVLLLNELIKLKNEQVAMEKEHAKTIEKVITLSARVADLEAQA